MREVARGGMGELCLALRGAASEGERRLCVIKRIRPGSAELLALRTQFLDEARALLGLSHPNLVEVFDAGTFEGEHYLAMELIEGQDLRAVWNRCADLRRRLPVDLAIYTAREVARGLAYAHEVVGLGLVHSEIAPPHILLTYDGAVKVTDFGLAASSLRREITGPGMLMGRTSYLAPEQARGEEADHRSDIYSLGVVLWELLTGRQLLAASHRSPAAALAAARNPNIRRPSEVVRDLPDGLDAVVLKALALDPRRRYPSAERFRARLSEILARSFPGYDAAQAGAFIRDVFAREHRSAAQEFDRYLREDFSRIRVDPGDTVGISDDNDRPRMIMGPTDAASGGGMGDEADQVMTPRQIAEQRRGTVIADRFRIEELLSFDGMGALYRVRDLERGRPSVLRVLPESYTRDPELTSRFMRDAKEVSELGHPNIAQVLDIGKLDGGAVYSAMEFLHGQSIANIIRDEGKLSPSRATHVATQVCRALATAHEHGLIHRDLKPESVVLVAHEGDLDFAKVVDFGICKQVDNEGTASSPGMIIGTPDYMAPEQAAGAEANAASDIYALGCILFEMLTARLPFSGRNSIDVLRQKGSSAAPRADAIDPAVPAPLAEVIAKCLARGPEDRPESMRHLELELMRAEELSERGRSEASGFSPLPPPPEAGTLRAPPTPSVVTPVPPAAPPPPPAFKPAPAEPKESPLTSSSAARPATSKPTMTTATSSAATYKPSIAATSGAALPKPFTEPEVAADRAGRSIVPIALLGAAAVAVVLFVWPGVLRERPTDPGPGQPSVTEPTVSAGPESPTAASPASGGDSADVDAATTGVTTAADVAATTAAEVGDTSAAESAGSVTPPPGEPDIVVLVGKLELAAAENRWRNPADDNVALHMAKVEALEPDHEVIARIQKQAAETLKARAEIAASEKHWHDAVEAYRDLYAIYPEYKNKKAQKGFAAVLEQEAKILRYLKDKDPEQMLLVADDFLALDAKSFDGQLMRAEAYEAQGKWKEAAEAYAIAKKLRPKEKAASEGYARADKKAKAAGITSGG
ncbi:MAG: protein kinase [Nannocystaceae bacterium]